MIETRGLTKMYSPTCSAGGTRAGRSRPPSLVGCSLRVGPVEALQAESNGSRRNEEGQVFH